MELSRCCGDSVAILCFMLERAIIARPSDCTITYTLATLWFVNGLPRCSHADGHRAGCPLAPLATSTCCHPEYIRFTCQIQFFYFGDAKDVQASGRVLPSLSALPRLERAALSLHFFVLRTHCHSCEDVDGPCSLSVRIGRIMEPLRIRRHCRHFVYR